MARRVPPLPKEVTEPLMDTLQSRLQPQAVAHAQKVWSEWWRAPYAEACTPNQDALSWWITCVFRRALYIQVVRDRPLLKSSRGDLVVNPLEATVHTLTEEIAWAELRIGMETARRNYDPSDEEQS